ncbi:DUF3576 domain-containing protein [Aestuariibius insulae]|uniref:DUF3576 domain-containing protein n=1 Tax=Aestuariibius insulae TaxID=2058287 RepID=UPI00345F0BFE
MSGIGKRRVVRILSAISLVALVAACGQSRTAADRVGQREAASRQAQNIPGPDPNRESVFDLFEPADPDEQFAVNKYLWSASLDVLSFLPVQSVDPFTGVIVTGFGRPPGGGRPYRATIYITDPALDARSLNVALQSQSGPVSAETQRAVEDAILARARQLRINDSRL